MLADPPVVALAGNAVPLTVMRLTGSDDVTVCIAFPAYIVLTNSLSPLIPMISDIGATSSLAATLGMRFYRKTLKYTTMHARMKVCKFHTLQNWANH